MDGMNGTVQSTNSLLLPATELVPAFGEAVEKISARWQASAMQLNDLLDGADERARAIDKACSGLVRSLDDAGQKASPLGAALELATKSLEPAMRTIASGTVELITRLDQNAGAIDGISRSISQLEKAADELRARSGKLADAVNRSAGELEQVRSEVSKLPSGITSGIADALKIANHNFAVRAVSAHPSFEIGTFDGLNGSPLRISPAETRSRRKDG
jgi:methyl-accepting chemotaxis protein